MKNYKKLLLTLSFIVSFGTLLSSTANAALITQEFGVSGTSYSGYATVEIDDSLLFKGDGLTYFGLDELVDFEFWGWPFYEFFDFSFGIDTDNIYAGFEFMYFDMNDLFFTETWAYQMNIDRAFPEFSFLDIFSLDTGFVDYVEGTDVAFGDVSVVSEPASILFLGLLGMLVGIRRRAK